MSLALLDWRRRIARLYAEVRAAPDVVAAHGHWRRTRDNLLRTHPESPVPEAQRASYPGAPVAAYDPRAALRRHPGYRRAVQADGGPYGNRRHRPV